MAICITLALTVAAAAGLAASAEARPGRAGKGKLTQHPRRDDDGNSATDLALMPGQRLLAAKRTTFADAIDSFPLCCPAQAAFSTGQYAHNHGVAGNFYPYGWYGMKRRGNTLPAWLQDAGCRTALVGKWLNGYGARDAHTARCRRDSTSGAGCSTSPPTATSTS